MELVAEQAPFFYYFPQRPQPQIHIPPECEKNNKNFVEMLDILYESAII